MLSRGKEVHIRPVHSSRCIFIFFRDCWDCAAGVWSPFWAFQSTFQLELFHLIISPSVKGKVVGTLCGEPTTVAVISHSCIKHYPIIVLNRPFEPFIGNPYSSNLVLSSIQHSSLPSSSLSHSSSSQALSHSSSTSSVYVDRQLFSSHNENSIEDAEQWSELHI